ncbi:unnamed protein product [Protopolystoma xenopodis]|uniref:Uncharacterized protein n=1 Tax=Protopolystoma xenopodis TaxID=117903 RepID=A0A448XBW0_9PLAT|nr:unnamed protein product [Protopolystoma xenopodis]
MHQHSAPICRENGHFICVPACTIAELLAANFGERFLLAPFHRRARPVCLRVAVTTVGARRFRRDENQSCKGLQSRPADHAAGFGNYQICSQMPASRHLLRPHSLRPPDTHSGTWALGQSGRRAGVVGRLARRVASPNRLFEASSSPAIVETLWGP